MLKCYYRSPPEGGKKPKLRMIVADYPSTKEAVIEFEQAVMEQLCKDMEAFLKPMLILIKGGK